MIIMIISNGDNHIDKNADDDGNANDEEEEERKEEEEVITVLMMVMTGTPSQLHLDSCSVEIGRCGQSAIQAAEAEDNATKCR